MSYFDHVAVFINKDCALQVGPPQVREIAPHLFLALGRKPYVIRLAEDSKQQFLENLHGLSGKKYSYKRALLLWSSIVLYEKTRAVVRVDYVGGDRLICTDALLGCVPGIQDIRKLHGRELDYTLFGAHSINDFLTLLDKGVFREVTLPYPFSLLRPNHKKFSDFARKTMIRASAQQTAASLGALAKLLALIRTFKTKRYWKAYILVLGLTAYLKDRRMLSAHIFGAAPSFWPRL